MRAEAFQVTRMVFTVIPKAGDPKDSIIVLIVDLPRPTWRQVTVQTPSTVLTMAAWQTSTPSAVSPAAAEACMVVVAPAERTAGSQALLQAASLEECTVVLAEAC